MDIDVARSQQKQVATAFHMLATLVLCLSMIVFLNAAADRAREQDEELDWRMTTMALNEMAAAFDVQADSEMRRMASQSLIADTETGIRVEARSLDDLRTFDASHFATAAQFSDQLDCLAEAVYYEARSENRVGQLAVAQVVMNRVRHSAYPDTLCDVVYQGSERVTGCQFTFTCDGSLRRVPNGRAWARAQRVAEHAYMGFGRDVTRRATHYHTVAVDPYWNDNLVLTRHIGTHIFYRFPTRRERNAGIVAQRDA